MINALNLIWIIPLSMIMGVMGVICCACVVIGKEAEEEEKRLRETIKETEYDY